MFAVFISFISIAGHAQQHPVIFFRAAEVQQVKAGLATAPLLKASINQLKAEVDGWLNKDVDVPFPKDPAGAYTHDRHRSNYMLMFNSGVLYQLTGNKAYAELVKQMLLKYAVLNPTLKNHPEAKSSSPGHLFWQALNDANWMVYTGMAYDCIYTTLTPAERTTIENGAFKPEVDFMTKDLNAWFNLVHNHGVWACAGVGIIGLASHNDEYVQWALYGTNKDGKSGFLAQLSQLYAPDGYYTEGPYYVRYALLPFYVFANALQNARPGLKIFSYRDSILKKALMSALQETNTDGTFFPVNDAIKEKDYTSNEIVTAVDIAWKVYGADSALLYVAGKQNKVLPNGGGAAIAQKLAGKKNMPAAFPYRTVEFTDGAKGDEGGISFLRSGKGNQLTTLIFKYTAHGLSHGHFDKLNINVFDQGNEILTDYGSARFVNLEPKYGGRYLPENEAYAAQTIAHNTITADEQSHFNGSEKTAEQYHAEKLYSSIGKNLQVVAAADHHAYDGIGLYRTVYLLQLPEAAKPLVIDIFRTEAAKEHQYDLPFNYAGQVVSTSFKYQPFTTTQNTLGTKNAYRFLWKEASATPGKGMAQLTFLNKKSFYTVSTLTEDATQVFLTRIGANDPNFNLRRETSFIIRKKSSNGLFISAVEMHGNFDAVSESTAQSSPQVTAIQLLQNDQEYTVAEITYKGKPLLVLQANQNTDKTATHTLQVNGQAHRWTGPFLVQYDHAAL